MTLVEVMVAVLLVAVILLAAGHAIATALRSGQRALQAVGLVAALATEASLLEAAAHAGTPCSALTFGTRREGELSVRWRQISLAAPGAVRLVAELGAGRRHAADSITLVLACR